MYKKNVSAYESMIIKIVGGGDHHIGNNKEVDSFIFC